MKKTALTLTLILALLFSAVTTLQHISLATANPDRGPYLPSPPVLTMQSPKYNATYYLNDVLLNFTVKTPTTWIGPTNITEISYNFDGRVVTLWNLTDYSLQKTQQFTIFLNTSTGPHTLQVNIHSESTYYSNPKCGNPYDTVYPMEVSQTIPFTVDTGAFPPLSVSIASPENKTYDTFEVPLKFSVNELDSQITYSLDGQNNVTATGNTTLTGLSNGEHNITVYATNAAGNVGASETTTFTVAKETEPFPMALVSASVVLIAVIIAGLAFYFKKRKR